jgi:hypothetical protein
VAAGGARVAVGGEFEPQAATSSAMQPTVRRATGINEVSR